MFRILPPLLWFSLPLVTAMAQGPATVFETARPASLEILVNGRHSGSGVVVDPKGMALTAAHVVASHQNRLEVLSPTAGRLAAELVAVDWGHDMALLRLPAKDQAYRAVELAKQAPTVGEEIYLFGVPIFRRPMLQRGMVSLPENGYEYYGNHHLYVSVRYVSVTIQHGTSGGPWLNAQGQLVGVQSGSLLDNGAMAGVAFMGPLPAARGLLNRQHSASTPSLGLAVEELWQHGEEQLKRFPPNTEGLVARAIRDDGPAARAGFHEWDLIQAVDDRPVQRVHELLDYVRSKRPGDSVRLKILAPDGAGQREQDVTLGELEVGWPE